MYQSKTALYISYLTLYAPDFEKVKGAYGFGVVRASVRAYHFTSWTVQARVLKFHIWIPHGKIADTYFFLEPSIKKNCLLYPYLPTFNPPTQNFFRHFWKKNFFAPFSSGNHDFPIMTQCKKKIIWFFFPAYQTKKYRIGVQQTNNFLRIALSELSPFQELYPIEKSEWNLVSRISRKVSELGASNLVSW